MASESAQSNLASSSTLYAQASKDWVIPAKPKPGRKPKKDSAASKDAHEVDTKGRRVQNRAAQRAFRERKQSQLAELQARVQSYERGEIERNVALQQISKHLKEENDQLKAENNSLKEEILRLKERLGATSAACPTSSDSAHRGSREPGKSHKRWRDESGYAIATDEARMSVRSSTRKRFRPETESPPPSSSGAPQYERSGAYEPSTPSPASSPDSNGFSRSPFSPVPFSTLPPGGSGSTNSQPAPLIFATSSSDAYKRLDVLGASPPYDTFDCGLCTENTPCVCRELAMQEGSGITGPLSAFGTDYTLPRSGASELKVEDTENRVATAFSNVIDLASASENVEAASGSQTTKVTDTASQSTTRAQRGGSFSVNRSINNGPYQIRLPSPEPAPATSNPTPTKSVPLRIKGRGRSASGKVWQVTSGTPTCSGDPSNCPACKDDDFGKAFCRALGDSASVATTACASCPNPEACGKEAHPTDVRSIAANGSDSSSASRDPQVIELSSPKPQHFSASSAVFPQSNSDGLPSILSSHALSAPKPSSNQTDEKPSSSAERIPVNEAWARLKSHPNIAFADLSMLADVVARRTKCSGPVAVIHPAPGSITPERDAARSPAALETVDVQMKETLRQDSSAVVLSDRHVPTLERPPQNMSYPSSSAEASSSVPPTSRITLSSAVSLGPGAKGRPALVPQEELRECGRRRIREVDAAGVREALRILDAQFGKHT